MKKGIKKSQWAKKEQVFIDMSIINPEQFISWPFSVADIPPVKEHQRQHTKDVSMVFLKDFSAPDGNDMDTKQKLVSGNKTPLHSIKSWLKLRAVNVVLLQNQGKELTSMIPLNNLISTSSVIYVAITLSPIQQISPFIQWNTVVKIPYSIFDSVCVRLE